MNAGTGLLSRRFPRLAIAAVAAAGLVAGCGGGGSSAKTASGSSSASSSASSSSSSAGPRQSPLTKGLLPASAFGPQATVVSLTLQQFQQATSSKLGSATDVQVNPPQCASALNSAQPNTDQIKDLVAQAATAQGSVTVEAILTGNAVNGAVDKLKAATTNCQKVTATSPQIGTATVTFAPIDVSSVSGQAAAAQLTTTVQPPNKPAVTVPALVGLAQDKDRLILLVTASPSAGNGAAPPPSQTGPPDQASFTQLLKKAYDTEKQALD